MVFGFYHVDRLQSCTGHVIQESDRLRNKGLMPTKNVLHVINLEGKPNNGRICIVYG